MDSAELRYLAYLVFMILAFIFGGKFHIMPPTISIVMMVVMLCPKIGLVTWEEASKRTNWGNLFQIGFFMAFASACSSTGLGDWLAANLFGWVNTSDPLILLIVIVCLSHVVTALVPGGGAAVLMIPPIYAISVAAGINTGYLMLAMALTATFSQFQPIQPQYLVVRGNTGGYLQIRDFVLPNIIVSAV